MTGLLPVLSPAAWAICLAAVTLAAALQRITGQGFGMVAAPLIALVAPQMLPAALLVLGMVVGWRAVRADLSAVTVRELPAGMTGRALGAVVAALIAGPLVASGGLGIAVALIVLVAVGLSLAGLRVAITQATLFSAGLAAGVMGTLTAIGAPPMALLYQHEDRARSVAMQNTFFLFGMAVSVAALFWQGLIDPEQVTFALLIAPGVAGGLRLAAPLGALAGRLPARAITLALATGSAVVLLVRSL